MGNRNEVPSATEFGLLRAFLAKPDENGKRVSQKWIEEHTNSSMTRQEAAEALKTAMRELPKAT